MSVAPVAMTPAELVRAESVSEGCIKAPGATVYAIGDLEGDIVLLYKILKDQLDLIEVTTDPPQIKWKDSNKFVVQLGDQVDRDRVLLDKNHELHMDIEMLLFSHLLHEISIPNQETLPGDMVPRFWSVIGNHEFMNCCGQMGYVHKINAKKLNDEGHLARKELFGPNGPLRELVLAKKLVVKINNLVFSHAGISQATVDVLSYQNKQAQQSSPAKPIITNIDVFVKYINDHLKSEDDTGEKNIDRIQSIRSNGWSVKNLIDLYPIASPYIMTEAECTKDSSLCNIFKNASYINLSYQGQTFIQYHIGVLWDRAFSTNFFVDRQEEAASKPNPEEFSAQYSVPNLGPGIVQIIGHNNAKGDIMLFQGKSVFNVPKPTNFTFSDQPSVLMVDSYNRGRKAERPSEPDNFRVTYIMIKGKEVTVTPKEFERNGDAAEEVAYEAIKLITDSGFETLDEVSDYIEVLQRYADSYDKEFVTLTKNAKDEKRNKYVLIKQMLRKLATDKCKPSEQNSAQNKLKIECHNRITRMSQLPSKKYLENTIASCEPCIKGGRQQQGKLSAQQGSLENILNRHSKLKTMKNTLNPITPKVITVIRKLVHNKENNKFPKLKTNYVQTPEQAEDKSFTLDDMKESYQAAVQQEQLKTITVSPWVLCSKESYSKTSVFQGGGKGSSYGRSKR